MSHLLITKNHVGNRGVRKRTLRTNLRIGTISLLFGVLTMIGVITLLYLTHFNSVSTKGYQLKRLEDERMLLLEEDEIRNMRLAEMRALSMIKETEKVKSMVKPRGNQLVFQEPISTLASN